MNKNVLIVISAVVFLAIGYVLGVFVPLKMAAAPDLDTEVDTFAYSIGFDTGSGLTSYLEQMKIMEEFSSDNFITGVKDGFKSDESVMSQNEMQMIIQSYIMKKQAEAQQTQATDSEGNLQEGIDFLNENKDKSGISTTESGLQYEVIEEGSGAQPNAEDEVVVHYTGTLLDGTEFDSSVERGEPATFPLNRVIPGWTEAIQLMKEGAKYKFYIPSELAYGQTGSGTIPPNSVLIFEVELIEVKK
jgi:FKBP-type peptidyl-prolyl cis-trans isomerase